MRTWAAACGLGRALFRAQDFRRCYISPLLSADNYNQTANDPTTKAQSAQRRPLNEGSGPFSGWAILAGYRKQRPAACEQHCLRGLGSPTRPPPVVPGCPDLRRISPDRPGYMRPSLRRAGGQARLDHEALKECSRLVTTPAHELAGI